MRIVLLGPPGAGKGTQSKKISERFKIPTVSMGDVLRSELKKETPLAEKIRKYIEKGALVPDELLFDMIESLLDSKELEKGFILDGFPRTLVQAEALKGFLAERDVKLDGVVYIELASEEILERLTSRRVCSQCGKEYNIFFNPPSREGICDICGGALKKRADDKEDVIEKRIRVYFSETAPLIEYYRREKKLVEISGKGQIEEVFNNISDCLINLVD